MYTNRKGMTFGVIFGAILMTMLPFLNGLNFKSRFANSVLGVVMGSPLGLCVNCSTPVAHGLYAAGARPETMLAAMVSSPTLNVIVLTMLFAMFPSWLAFLKIGTTAAFILIGIPLLTRWLNPPLASEQISNKTDLISHTVEQKLTDALCVESEDLCREADSKEGWPQAIRWLTINFTRNLWYLIKITVPLMILAGVLGAAMATLVPLDKLATLLPDGRLMSLVSMALLAIIGLLLPSPMTFDVILTAVLYNAGLPVKYVAVLLFTLGVFSVYPFMTLWRRMSRSIAIGMFVTLTLLGMAAGVLGNRYHSWDLGRQEELVLRPFTRGAAPLELPRVDRLKQGTPAETLLPQLQTAALHAESLGETGGLQTSRILFNSPRATGATDKPLMRRYDQKEFGISEHENYSLLKLDYRYSVSRGIASGDVNRDGWTDFVVTSDVGLAVYLNQQGTTFTQQRSEVPILNDLLIANAALVDLNNDGWLDLWFSSLRRGNYVIYNQEGRFTQEKLTQIPNQPDAVLTNAPAFGDLDRDGKLDIVLGNVSPTGKNEAGIVYNSTHNSWLRQGPTGFELQPLPGMNGESLTTLLTDINQDGMLDLLVGNDMITPDMIYLGDGHGQLRLLTKADGLIPATTNFTMSISSADLDNDLIPEILFGSVSNRDRSGQVGAARRLTPAEICAELTEPGAHSRCEQFYNFRQIAGHAMSPGDIWECRNLPTSPERDACVAFKIVQTATVESRNEKTCDQLPNGWDYLSFLCHSHFAPSKAITNSEMYQAIPQRSRVNVLLKQNAGHVFEEKTQQFGLTESGFTWNAKFADLDNDGWQDLFVVNGWVRRVRTESNHFYRNVSGQRFEDATEQYGLESNLNTLSYTYLDLDNDGDLDIIVVPTVGPLSVYVNQTPRRQSIAFELHDERGNYYGIGSKIIINYGKDQHQMRELQAGGGYLSFDGPIAYFGLADAQAVRSVTVQWSTGETTVLDREFKSGARYVIKRARS
ncbi:MAG: hypothetical protein DMF69_01370 [Acidobacteria bacterium]|nr:MAG: hypothetical protein DMF69_01370 [Acidobacteriota bacterium]